MSRFYFHLHNSLDVPDEVGEELPSLEAAQAHAVSMLRYEVAEAVKLEGRIVLTHRIDVEDEIGDVLATVHVHEAVQVNH